MQTAKVVETLIEWLRGCETPKDLYEFQRCLFGEASQVDERRAHCARVAKRLRAGKALPEDAPDPPRRGQVEDPAAWEFERLVYERLYRQLRAVGDGLAWYALGYNRRAVLALSRNASPGPLVKRAGRGGDPTTGLAHELGAVQQLWTERGRFALLHDLTNCLRIGDITDFDADGKGWLYEIKANPRRVTKAQTTRMMRGWSITDATLVY